LDGVTSELDPQIVINWLNVVGWFAAGFWLLRGHAMRREDFPKIDLHASLRPVVLAPGGRDVEVVVEVEGLVHLNQAPIQFRMHR
jgi:hypothetical protein